MNRLNETEHAAWIGYRRMRLLLDLQIQRDLMRDSGLSDPDFDVLSNLSEATGQRMRLTELAAHLRWSKSRLSHHIGRMEGRGLVSRQEVAHDGRGAAIVLTSRGVSTIEEATPGHVASLRRHFIDLLTEDELRTLAQVSRTVLSRLE
ncbi:MarR family winged helix-turn-helix transcriptional regulator [Nonomuraea dietziae]|uniref:MarR family winged helix-turn-helix transcriptional regulator n=1 Tax=Nonomuraea dietziae TaxID=65515 RepID=UPI0033C21745